VLIGDGAASIRFDELDLVDPYPGQAALRLTAAAPASQPYFIDVNSGTISGGASHGRGVQIDYGRNAVFRFDTINTEDVAVTLGPHAGCGILMDGRGLEQRWTYRIENGARGCMTFPARAGAQPSAGTP
jgi:hypothetical protein